MALVSDWSQVLLSVSDRIGNLNLVHVWALWNPRNGLLDGKDRIQLLTCSNASTFSWATAVAHDAQRPSEARINECSGIRSLTLKFDKHDGEKVGCQKKGGIRWLAGLSYTWTKIICIYSRLRSFNFHWVVDKYLVICIVITGTIFQVLSWRLSITSTGMSQRTSFEFCMYS